MRAEPAAGPAARRRRRTRRLVAVAGLAALAWVLRDLPAAFGGRPTGERAARMRRSPRFRAGAFHNPVTARTSVAEIDREVLWELLFRGRRRCPRRPIPVQPDPDGPEDSPTPDGPRQRASDSSDGPRQPAPNSSDGPPATDGRAGTVVAGPPPATADGGLSVIWYGHASALVEIGGRRVLVDPVWSRRCSPSALVGPRRLHPPPVPLERLPPVDAVLISHDHYDHLDMSTARTLRDTQAAPFVVPLGVGAHLERWRVPAERIIELDWGERVRLAGLELVATAARHFSGRGFSRDRTLWSSWVVTDGRHRVFYSGDSGYFEGYPAIGAEYGPFDLTLVQIGAYDGAWPNIHMFPEDAVSAHLDLRGGLLVPVHWATFDLARHPWAEPVERLWAAARTHGVRLAVPRPGQRVRVDDPPPVDGWWRTVVAADDPGRVSGSGDPAIRRSDDGADARSETT